MQGVCPGLTHAQRFGISYQALTNTIHEDNPDQREAAINQGHSLLVISSSIAEHKSSSGKNDGNGDSSEEI